MKSSVKAPNTDCLQVRVQWDYYWKHWVYHEEDWDEDGIITRKTGIFIGVITTRAGIITGKTEIIARKTGRTLGYQ